MRRRKLFGIDLFEVVIQAVITIALIAATDNFPGPEGEAMAIGVAVSSLLLLAWRRRRAMAAEPESDGAGERVEDLEYRVAELENAQGRVLELEERLDFAERLLARQRASESLPEGRINAT